MAVDLAFDAVLGRVSRFREVANDFEEFASGVFLTLIWRKADRFANPKLVRCHQHLRRPHYACIAHGSRVVPRFGTRDQEVAEIAQFLASRGATKCRTAFVGPTSTDLTAVEEAKRLSRVKVEKVSRRQILVWGRRFYMNLRP